MPIHKVMKKFINESINIEDEKMKVARRSRDWLKGKIESFTETDSDFPKFYKERHVDFGSFTRKTKIKKLDDIDMMFCISAEGTTYSQEIDKVRMNVPETAEKLLKLCHPGTKELNSRKVVEIFKKNLGKVAQYNSNYITRNQEAATLYLQSYGLNFDIVPCFFATDDFYIIPDGNGHWKKTDPRKDRDRVTYINQQKEGKVLEVIRLLKYWNRRPTMPLMGSYLLENIVLKYYFENKVGNMMSVWEEFLELLKYIESSIYCSIEDPKGFQGNLNNLSLDDKYKIFSKAQSDSDIVKEILQLSKNSSKDNLKAINALTEKVLGKDFPKLNGDV
ncbi:MAG: SMODS domain-containing nucleotidyltransferase [Fusobacteriaceae bacterium]